MLLISKRLICVFAYWIDFKLFRLVLEVVANAKNSVIQVRIFLPFKLDKEGLKLVEK
jgi:hypothetical protein